VANLAPSVISGVEKFEREKFIGARSLIHPDING